MVAGSAGDDVGFIGKVLPRTRFQFGQPSRPSFKSVAPPRILRIHHYVIGSLIGELETTGWTIGLSLGPPGDPIKEVFIIYSTIER
jgi:hypothetical protein